MTVVSPQRLLRAVAANAMAVPMRPHHRIALAARSYAELLTAFDLWFLEAVLKLPAVSDAQRDRLNAIASKVERGRK
jgi:hypothetical protein